MSFFGQIHALRAEIAGCRVVAFGDARARLVLRASHDTDVRREVLDQLCEEAASCFELIGATAVGGAAQAQAMVLTSEDMRIYLSGADTGPDFLCLVCDLSCDPDMITTIGHQALHRLTETQ